MHVMKRGRTRGKGGETYNAKVARHKAITKTMSKEERSNYARNQQIIEHYESLKEWYPQIPPTDFFDTSRYEMSLTQEQTPEGVLKVVFKFTPKGGA